MKLFPADGTVSVGVEEAEDRLQLLAIGVHGIEHRLAGVLGILHALRKFHVELRHEGAVVRSRNKTEWTLEKKKWT